MCGVKWGKKQFSKHAGRFVFVRLGQKGGKLRVDPVGKQTPTAGTAAAAAAEPVRVSAVCVRLAGGSVPSLVVYENFVPFPASGFFLGGAVFPVEQSWKHMLAEQRLSVGIWGLPKLLPPGPGKSIRVMTFKSVWICLNCSPTILKAHSWKWHKKNHRD